MAIKFKVIERGQPGVPGGGEKKFYASAVMAGELYPPGGLHLCRVKISFILGRVSNCAVGQRGNLV